MDTTGPSGVTITPIYWQSSGSTYSFPAGYENTINGYVNNIAAASGTDTNVYSIDTEYYQIVGGVKTYLKYHFTAGVPIVDTDPFPANGCTPAAGYTACLTDAQIRTELTAITAAASRTTNLANFYPMFFPPNVETQDLDGSTSASGFCGYHRSFGTGASEILYGNEPFLPQGCGSGQAPNGSLSADGAIDTLSHEISEVMTDPDGNDRAWNDSSGFEIGDICGNSYNGPLGSTNPADPGDTEYNQLINGGKYYTQAEFSNYAFATFGTGHGCQYSEALAQHPATATGTTVASIFANAFPNVLPADGASTSAVRVAVGDNNGDAVSGDPLGFSTYVVNGTGVCGTLSSASSPTGSDGSVTVTYTASNANVECAVVANDARSGKSATADIYQGTYQADAPRATDTFPTSLKAGGTPVTFTTTFTNPSAQALTDSQVDFYIFSGDATSPNVDASQVNLSYSTTGPAGKFIPLQLSGSTVTDGAIQGTVGTPSGTTVAAGRTETITYHVSLSASIPGGNPVIAFEAYLDQVNPATGSGATLADTLATNINVTAASQGYDEVASDGGLFSFGDAHFYGSEGGSTLNKPIVGMAATPDGGGYWLVASDGGIFSFGDAHFYGSEGGSTLNKPIVGMAATPDGGGYWLVASDGGIFSFGDAHFYGSEGGHVLNKPIVGIAANPEGGGYWLVASDGGIFTFGDATFAGSEGGTTLNKPIVGIAANPEGGGYWLVASDGGIFTFGNAGFYGSQGGTHLNQPVVSMLSSPDGGGYWLVASDGGVFTHGNAAFYGSEGGMTLNKPVVGTGA